MGAPLASGTVDVPLFDCEALIAVLRTDQAGNSGPGLFATMSTLQLAQLRTTAATVKSTSKANRLSK
jgi:hypothetical protein